MSLIKELKGQTVVILAQTFNPSVFNQHWLIKNEFIKDEDISNSIFTPGITQLVTPAYNLIVVPEQLQFIQNNVNIKFEESLKNCLNPIIEKLQEVPYTAVGINFTWIIEDTEKKINQLSKEFFYIDESNIFNSFSSSDARFGSYMSKDFLNSRLKLDVKPINIKENNSIKKEFIQFAFNFHIDLSVENCAQELLISLSNFSLFFAEANRIIKSI